MRMRLTPKRDLDHRRINARVAAGRGGRRHPIRINPLLFSVQLTDVVDISENKVGIVTAREGAALATGEIAGPVVQGHNCSRTRRPS